MIPAEFIDAAFGIAELVPAEPSAAVAKHRLRHIIAADREAVPVLVWRKRLPLRAEWGLSELSKPVYRQEVRR